MSALTIGDQTLDLTLSLLPGSQGNVAEGVEPAFTADFTTWDGDGEETDDAQTETGTDTVDTLVLSAADATLADGRAAGRLTVPYTNWPPAASTIWR